MKSSFFDKVFNVDALEGMVSIPDGSVDLIIADPPYGLGKDYGNNSDKKSYLEFMKWTKTWLTLAVSKLSQKGSIYLFTTWRYSPEIFMFIKQTLGMLMINEIIWDRNVPSMGGSTRKYTSVHDTIGFFAHSKDYYFDLDSIRIPYDPETKKARSRSIFIGKKWLEVGYNPKDLWRVTRLHRIHSERENHPTQKPLEIIERMVKASCPVNGLVLDPFCGTGTTVAACILNNRHYLAYEINPDYYQIILNRISRIESGTYKEEIKPNNHNINKNHNKASKSREKKKSSPNDDQLSFLE